MKPLPLAPQQLFVLVIIPIIAWLYWSTLGVLAGRWVQWHNGLSHGLLVTGVFLWLLWQRPCDELPKGHFALRAVLLGLASLLWFLLQSVQINALAELALLLVVMGAYNAWLGFRQSWLYKGVLFLPLFATSIWGELSPAAMHLSGYIVGHLVEFVGITAFIDGTTITLPYGQIIIADGCSGLRYILIALALGQMLACLNQYPKKVYWVVMALALVLALATNWARIFILVLVGYYTQMQSSLVSEHEMFGWMLFAGVVLPPLFFAPHSATKHLTMERFSPPVSHLVILLAVLSLGPVLLGLSLRTPAPAAWIPSLHLRAIASPAWVVQAPMPQAGLLEQGMAEDVWVQRWQFQRIAAADKLVPYIEGNWHPDSACTPKSTDALGAWFECSSNDYPVLVLRRFNVGDFATTDLRWAKLWQLPAQWMGANLFSLTQWQQKCDANGCEQAAGRITALAAPDK